MERDIIIYTDGGCSGNPGPGGWGYVVLDGAEPAASAILDKRWGAENGTTNNRMELLGVINALEWLRDSSGFVPSSVCVYTDSQYVQKGISQWIVSWKRNGWRTAGKDPVKNKDLWIRLDELAALFNPRWRWVKGHAGNEYNEICDAMTQEAIASLRG